MPEDTQAVPPKPEQPPAPQPGVQPAPPVQKPAIRRKKRLAVAGGLLLLAVLVGGTLAFLSSRSSDQPNQNTGPEPAPQSTQQMTQKNDDTPNTTQLKTFNSDQLGLEIAHPADWTTAEKDGGLRVVSPEFTYQTWDKGDVTGHFKVYIRKGARDIDGKYIGRGVVIEPSEKLVYADPGVGQRKDTNFSRFGALTSDHFTFFMVTGDFNLKKDDQLGPSYGREPDTYIIAGGFSSKAQTEDLDFSNVLLDQYAQKRAYTQGANIVKSLKLN